MSEPVTLKSIVTDVLTWIGLGQLATGLPIPAAPVPAWVDSLWLVVRQTVYSLNTQRPVAQTTVSAQGSDIGSGTGLDSADLADLLARPDASVSQKPDGTIDVIDGTFTDTAVTSVADAAQLLNGMAPLLGAPAGFATQSNITVQRVGQTATDTADVAETFYRVHDTVDGVPVLGSEVILLTDSDGKVTGLFNNYDSRTDSIDVTPDARIDDAGEATAVAAVAYFNSIADDPYRWLVSALIAPPTYKPELVVDARSADASPVLAWRVVVDPSDATQLLGLSPQPGNTYFIAADGANPGAVIRENSNAQALTPLTTTAYDLRLQAQQINVAQAVYFFFFPSYTLDDLSRNISTYMTTYQFFGWGTPVIPGAIIQLGWFGWDPSAVSAHANLEKVYDYYKNVLNLTSFDGNGAAVQDSIEYNPRATFSDYFTPYNNAFWDATEQQFAFGNGGNLEAALDIVGHEFTHAVVSYAVGDGGTVLDDGEPGSLNEAFADIMGSLIEGKSGQGRWLIGEDSNFPGGAVRNLADPSSISTAYGPYRDNYQDRYTGSGDDGGEHINSTIFSHAAYLMMTDPATAGISNAAWANLFYHSLYRLSDGATFTAGRAAVLSTAGALGFTQNQQDAIARAFDSVGIS